ncbi:MAG TPA: tRNA dihydrouridine synthase DusB [Tahibacter sp.]|nr:tRNA dihydrouridine synthase DusB [Tahibacter sp.]
MGFDQNLGVAAFRVGGLGVSTRSVLAPLSGVTDLAFRRIAQRFGAGLVVSEMVASDEYVRGRAEARLRAEGEGISPHVVQLAGCDPYWMAEAARLAEASGAAIIDINMGCPAKKVCNVYAGSALLQDEPLVARIVQAVVAAVDVPVTLKIRTGWNRDNRNGLRIARIAEDAGIAALAVHGRTRADLYEGEAEYDTIAAIKAAVRIPVLANGDVDSPRKAQAVLRHTGADGLLIGRAAQGRPWIFREIAHYLATGELLPPPEIGEVRDILLGHLQALHAFYGELQGVRIARKHLGWYAKDRPENAAFRAVVNRAETAEAQLRLTRDYFDALAAGALALPDAA